MPCRTPKHTHDRFSKKLVGRFPASATPTARLSRTALMPLSPARRAVRLLMKTRLNGGSVKHVTRKCYASAQQRRLDRCLLQKQ
jgi:hypothetical protein